MYSLSVVLLIIARVEENVSTIGGWDGGEAGKNFVVIEGFLEIFILERLSRINVEEWNVK